MGGALILLLVALQLARSGDAPASSVYSDETGTVARREKAVARSRDRDEPAFGVGSVVAILILIGGGAFALYLKKKPMAGAPGLPIESLGTLQLAPNQQLRLVSCGEEVLLLGVTSGQISLLRSFPRSAFDKTSPAAVREGSSKDAVALSAPFVEFLRQYAGDSMPPAGRLN